MNLRLKSLLSWHSMAFRFRSLNAAQENAECRNRIDVVRRERLQLIQADGQPVATI